MNLPAALIIMDGFGIDQRTNANAITLADTPRLTELFNNFPHTQLEASGLAVGLPEGQMGNSEVGHLNIGAGRVVFQELTRINIACEDGLLDENEVIISAMEKAKDQNRTLHLMGLLSDGGVHSSNFHLYSLINTAVKLEVPHIHIHCFMDGRDVPPASGLSYIKELENFISALGTQTSDVCIASIHGRYYGMDRDNRWDRVEKSYNTLVMAENYQNISAEEAMRQSYSKDITDEFVVPIALSEKGIQDSDSLIFFNFRPDRAREITKAFVLDDFSGFERIKRPHVNYVCLTEYDPTIPAPIAFEKSFPENVLADVLAHNGLKQYHIAETEKYAHVTFFLNGGREEPKLNESRKLIASPKVATYDLQPEMSAPEVTSALIEAIKNDEADVYIVNYANCDMVGHTGVVEAAKKAVEAVDTGVGAVIDAIKEKNGIVFITADHGNADKMFTEDGTPHTAHTTAPVPFIMANFTNEPFVLTNNKGALCDIAPTLLDVIGIEIPEEMTGKSLIAQ